MRNAKYMLVFFLACLYSLNVFGQRRPQNIRGLTNYSKPKLKFQLVKEKRDGDTEVMFVAENKYTAQKYHDYFQMGIRGSVRVLLVFDFIPGLKNGKGEYEILLSEQYQLSKVEGNIFFLNIGEKDEWEKYNHNRLMLYMDY